MQHTHTPVSALLTEVYTICIMTKEFNRCFPNARQGKIHQAYQQSSGKFPTVTCLHSRLGINMDIVYSLGNKQTNTSCLIIHEKQRGPLHWSRVCGQTVCVHTSLRCICFLISHRHMRGFPASSRPFEILPACLFMSSTRVFLGLRLFFSFPELPSLFASKGIQQQPPATPPAPAPATHMFLLKCILYALW